MHFYHQLSGEGHFNVHLFYLRCNFVTDIHYWMLLIEIKEQRKYNILSKIGGVLPLPTSQCLFQFLYLFLTHTTPIHTQTLRNTKLFVTPEAIAFPERKKERKN